MNDLQCPLCNSHKIKKIYTYTVNEISNVLAKKYNFYQTSRIKKIIFDLWKQNESTFYKCVICRYGFVIPYISGNSDFYSILYPDNFEYPFTKWEYEKTLESIKYNMKLNSNKNKKLIEFGAGSGNFLSLVSPKFVKQSNVFSTEYSQSGCEIINRKGFQCEKSSISKIAILKKDIGFDYICMFQVLEHLNDINHVFESINSISKNGTNLYIAVPNELLRRSYDKRGIHLDLPPIHVGKFETETFKVLAKKFGWELDEFAFECAVYSAKVKKFIFTLYNDTFASKGWGRSKNRILKYIYRYIMVLFIFVNYIDLFLKLRNKKFGTSFWVKLVKK